MKRTRAYKLASGVETPTVKMLFYGGEKTPSQAIATTLPANPVPYKFAVQHFVAHHDWLHGKEQFRKQLISDEEWAAERVRYATLVLRECVEVDPDKRGGIPVIRGTRLTVAEIIAELAEGKTIREISTRRTVEEDKLRKVLESLAIYMDRSPFE
jgi:uncharacterized protein (DUF433 family)